jgi:hypothetical protein
MGPTTGVELIGARQPPQAPELCLRLLRPHRGAAGPGADGQTGARKGRGEGVDAGFALSPRLCPVISPAPRSLRCGPENPQELALASPRSAMSVPRGPIAGC